MEQIKDFKLYLNLFGIISEQDFISLNSNFINKNNENLIFELGKFLSMKYKKDNYSEIILLSDKILNKFIMFDNNKLISILKKLLFIYSKFLKEIKRNYLYKWIINKTKYNLKINPKKHLKKPLQLSTKLTNKKYNHFGRANSSINIKLSITKSNELTILSNREKDSRNASMIKIKHSKIHNSKENLSEINKPKKTPKTTRQLIYNKLIKNISGESKEKNNEEVIKQNNIISSKNNSKKDKAKYFTELSRSNIERDKKINELRKKLNKKFDDIHTFTPLIFTKDYKRNKFRSSSQPFKERLKDDKRNRKINLNKIESEMLESERPKNKSIKKYKSHSADYELNYNNYHIKKKEKIKKIQEEIDKEKGITFRPHLNNKYNSKIIKEPFENRYNIYIEKIENESNTNRIINDLEKECTFCPKLNEKYDFVENFSERQYYYKRRKNAHIEAIKQKTKKNYSFKPEISQNSKDILIKKQNLIKLMKNQNDDLYEKKLTFDLNSNKRKEDLNCLFEEPLKKEEFKGRNFLLENYYTLKNLNEMLFKRVKKERDFLKENLTDKKINKLSTTDKSNDISQIKLNDEEQLDNNFQMKMKKIVNENYEREKLRQQRSYNHKNKVNNHFFPNFKYYELLDEN